MELRLQKCDTVIFLDYPLEVCLNGIIERRGKAHSDIPWVSNDEDDAELIQFAKSYISQSRPMIMELLDRYSNKDIYIFKSRAETNEFLANLQQ